jgi:hypothetical protein
MLTLLIIIEDGGPARSHHPLSRSVQSVAFATILDAGSNSDDVGSRLIVGWPRSDLHERSRSAVDDLIKIDDLSGSFDLPIAITRQGLSHETPYYTATIRCWPFATFALSPLLKQDRMQISFHSRSVSREDGRAGYRSLLASPLATKRV